MKNLLTASILFASILSAMAQCGPELPNKYPLGAGLNGISDYGFDRVFNNVFKTNRSLSTNLDAPWNYVAPTTDANGWPTQDFGSVVMADMDSTMGGTYRIRFNGQATITPVASGFTVQNQVYDSPSNTTTADLVYPASIPYNSSMFIKFTNTQFSTGVAGIKNLMIMKPGLDFNAPTFSQQFLDHISRFECLRFMDWRSTNANTDSLWVNRRLPTNTTQSGPNGIAWEYCIELANTTNKDIWINVPHKADSLYIANLAQLFNTTLEPDLHLYIEHSNEVWNFGFQQAGYNRDAALYEVATNPNSLLYWDGNTSEYTLAQRRHGLRTKLINDVFKAVMGPSAQNTRFRTMLGVQLFGFYPFTEALSIIIKHFGNPAQHLYGIAIAPYFDTQDVDDTNTATVQEVVTALQTSVDERIFPTADNQIELYAARSRYFGLKLYCYEGGPDTFGPNNIMAKRSASRTPEMKTICQNFLTKWYQYSPDGLFNWFTAGAGSWTSQYGTWSLTEVFENSSKLQAMDAILTAPVTPSTAGHAIPGVVDARFVAGSSAAQQAAACFTPTGWKVAEEWLIRVPMDSAGDYTLQLNTATTSTGEKAIVSFDNVYIDTLAITNTGSTTTFAASPTYTIPNVGRGLHTLRLRWVVSNPSFRVQDFTFTKTSQCIDIIGVDKPSVAGQFMVYPNPCSTALQLPAGSYGSVTVIDAMGRTVLQGIRGSGVLNVEPLAPGLYTLTTNGGHVARFVKE